MLEQQKPASDTEEFLTSAGLGRTIVKLCEKQTVLLQGEAPDSVFYLQSGRAKLTVFAKNGREATITALSAGEFVGEESLSAHRHSANAIEFRQTNYVNQLIH
jgi:CRP-like cAMP-binding protein